MRVVFRVDAADRVGSGHVMRCLTLADFLADGGAEILFVCRAHDGEMSGIIKSHGFKCRMLPRDKEFESGASDARSYLTWLGAPPAVDAAQTRECMGRSDWLVIDHYGIGREWEILLRPVCRKIMVIDDLADRRHVCDLLLDQTYERRPEAYRDLVDSGCHVLTGTRYALLRKEFQILHERACRMRGDRTLDTVMIFMGGSDYRNINLLAARALVDSRVLELKRIIIVLGPQNRHEESFRALSGRMEIELHRETNNMAAIMLQADAAVGAAGTTSWERCCMGLPTLTYIYAKNQQEIAQRLESAGATLTWETSEQLLSHMMQLQKSDALLHQMSDRCMAVCDGQGARRAVNWMSRLC